MDSACPNRGTALCICAMQDRRDSRQDFVRPYGEPARMCVCSALLPRFFWPPYPQLPRRQTLSRATHLCLAPYLGWLRVHLRPRQPHFVDLMLPPAIVSGRRTGALLTGHLLPPSISRHLLLPWSEASPSFPLLHNPCWHTRQVSRQRVRLWLKVELAWVSVC